MWLITFILMDSLPQGALPKLTPPHFPQFRQLGPLFFRRQNDDLRVSHNKGQCHLLTYSGQLKKSNDSKKVEPHSHIQAGPILQYCQPAGCSARTLQEGFPHDASYLPRASSPLRPRFPGYQSSISWKEIGRWGGPLWLHGFGGKLKIGED